MKLLHKEVVAATSPTIYIGKRTYKDKKTKAVRVARPYWAEYFIHGRQYQESLSPSRPPTKPRPCAARMPWLND